MTESIGSGEFSRGGPVRSGRAFTLLDGIVLVAATAVGFAFWRSLGSTTSDVTIGLTSEDGVELTVISLEMVGPPSFGSLFRTLLGLPFLLYPMAVAWTAALVVLRLLRPSSAGSRVACEPGFAACLGVLLAFAVKFAESISERLTFEWRQSAWTYPSPSDRGLLRGFGFPQTAGYILLAMVAIWGTLWATGGFRPQRSWMGRMLGMFWVVLSLMRIFLP